MEKEKELSFAPITDGLGFHPFSNGLPYAPVTKPATPSSPTAPRVSLNLSSGTGAVAAGAPSFVTRATYDLKPIQVRTPLPVGPMPQHHQLPSPQPQRVALDKPMPRMEEFTEPARGFGYLLKRSFA